MADHTAVSVKHHAPITALGARLSFGTRVWSWLRVPSAKVVDEIVQMRVDARLDQHEAWLGARLEQILDKQTAFDRRSRRDISVAADRDAALSSAQFAIENFPTATTFLDPMDTLGFALDAAPEKGMALEFGVYSGSTLRLIASRRSGGEVYGFDSFKGLPESWRTMFEAGKFAVDTLPKVPGAELVVGWFDETLSPFLAKHSGPIALLHIDCDLYSSTVTVLEHCGPRLVAGSIVVFDEYFNFPGWDGRHEHRAWQEYVARTGTRFTYLAYTANDEQVVLRIDEPGRKS